jgi:hypothetical protein
MAAPSTLTVSYGTSSTQSVAIPSGIDWTQAARNIFLGGGFSFTDATGLLTFIPASQITKVTAQ